MDVKKISVGEARATSDPEYSFNGPWLMAIRAFARSDVVYPAKVNELDAEAAHRNAILHHRRPEVYRRWTSRW